MARQPGQILIDARLLAYRRGGIARYVAGLTEWLPRVAPDLALRRIINRNTEPSAMDDCRVRTPPHFRFERVTLGAECAMRRPALLHSPDFIAPLAVGSRRIVTVHDLAFIRYPELLTDDARRYYGQIERSVAVADRVIAVSDYTARQLCDFTRVDPSKIVTIPNGIDHCAMEISHDEAITQVRDELDEDRAAVVLAERPVILVVGTIEPRKRQQLVLRALAHLPHSCGRFFPLVVLVGQRGWACEPIVTEIERSGADGQAVWIENGSDRLLSALYHRATLLAMPSLDEGFGLPLVEAMGAGLPVVAARRGALPEVTGGAAILVDDDNSEAWAEAIRSVIENEPLRQELRRAGRVRAAQFSWERTALETAELYREVLRH
ncbi:MAG TPA: glycosyltransferase family 1 protein [Nitrolancea sp.]